METNIIKKKESKNIEIRLIKNTFSNDNYNFSVVTFSKKYNIETGRKVFDTELTALNYYKKS